MNHHSEWPHTPDGTKLSPLKAWAYLWHDPQWRAICITDGIGCWLQSEISSVSNIRIFGNVTDSKPRLIRAATTKCHSSYTRSSLYDRLSKRLTFFLRDGDLSLDKFAIQATTSSISRALASKGWFKSTVRLNTRERNQGLRDVYTLSIPR
jgi:hypothetical protein